MNNVIIYTSSNCQYCHEAIDFLKENNIEYTEYNITKDKEAKKAIIKKGYMSVPLIIINRKEILGFDRNELSALLLEDNKSNKMKGVNNMSVYDFKAKSIDGDDISLNDYRGKVIIIVNTASKCGFTPQYEDLQKIYEKYNDKGLEILGFPCNQFEGQEPGDNSEVKKFCLINYGVSFPLFEKTDVRGQNAHPIFNYLIERAPFKGFDLNHPIGKILQSMLSEKHPEFLADDSIKWNFTKFLLDRNGNVVGRYEPTTSPLEMQEAIEKLL